MTAAINQTPLPRGIRNNNPGNIRFSPSNTWIGQEGKDKDDFCIFATMELGIRAMTKIFETYHEKHGCDMLFEYIRKWAPPTENNLPAYISHVCDLMGRGPQYIVLIPTDLPRLVDSFCIHENGGKFVPMSAIYAGVALTDPAIAYHLNAQVGKS